MNTMPIMSVSGIRGVVGETISPSLVSRIAFLQTKASGGGTIVVGRDTRPSGKLFAQAAFRGIRAAGGSPIDLGISPTPTTCVAVPELRASGGIIITASHNPIEYNGYKMIHASGRLFNKNECERIYTAFHRGEYPVQNDLDAAPDTPDGCVDGAAIHLKRICAHVDSDLIRSSGIKIAVDSINGAGGAVFPALLEALGVEWVGVNIKLDGDFVHNPEPKPEHLRSLAALLRNDDRFWGGFAFDPDADRLATMSEQGTDISEEMTLVFTLCNILSRRKSDIVTNLSTSMLIEDVAARFGVKVIRTKIGEANVVEGMVRHNCAVGGEGNGGLIFPAISWARDGLAALAIIIELMAKRRKPLSSLAAEWPAYAIVKEKFETGSADAASVIATLAERFSNEATDRLEGLKIIREQGWIHVRASNTEPVIRCYAEARTREQARELAEMVTRELRTLL